VTIFVLALGGYLASVTFFAVQLRRAPAVEREESSESTVAPVERRPRAFVGCACRRCSGRRFQRIGRAGLSGSRRPRSRCGSNRTAPLALLAEIVR
jgi:hypothetical protein